MKRYYLEMSVFIEAATGADAQSVADAVKEAAENVKGVTSASTEDVEETGESDDED